MFAHLDLCLQGDMANSAHKALLDEKMWDRKKKKWINRNVNKSLMINRQSLHDDLKSHLINNWMPALTSFSMLDEIVVS